MCVIIIILIFYLVNLVIIIRSHIEKKKARR